MERQVAGIKRAMQGVSNAIVKGGGASWGSNDENPMPTQS